MIPAVLAKAVRMWWGYAAIHRGRGETPCLIMINIVANAVIWCKPHDVNDIIMHKVQWSQYKTEQKYLYAFSHLSMMHLLYSLNLHLPSRKYSAHKNVF